MRGTIATAVLAAILVACSNDDKESLPKEASSGFDLKKDAFQFENFASGYDGSIMTADLAARMFGKDKVCEKGLSYCQANTDAEAWLETANEAMDAGRCEGFAVLSQMFYLGRLKPQDFGAKTVAELKLDENYALQKELAYWFSTQLVPNAVENRALMPRDAIQFMAEFMEGKEEFYRIGMVERTPAGFGDAHSLTPISFEQSAEDSNIYYIRVYDNNFPAVERRIRLDLSKNSWEYEGVNSEGTMMFRGGEADQNPLYFAPTVAREGTLPCPFCKGESRRTLIAHGVSPLLKDGAGNEVGFKDGKIVETNGGKVTPGFSMCIDGVAPVVVSANTPADMPVAVTLNPNGNSYQSVSIQGGSLGAVTVGGDLSSKQASQLQVSGSSVKIQPGGTKTTVRFVGEGGTIVEVSVSGDAGNVEVTRDPTTGKLSINTDDAKGAQVEVTLARNDVNNSRSTTNVKTSYSYTAGDGKSELSIDIPKDGWKGTTPPAATVTSGAESTPLTGDLCRNSVKDGDETDKDCGGSKCQGCSNGNVCKVNADCASTICGGTTSATPGQCVDHCGDGLTDVDETDVDCGGATCNPCAPGKMCKSASDCYPPNTTSEGSFPHLRYEKKPSYYCDTGVCTASPIVVGMVDSQYKDVQVRLTPDGLGDDATVQRVSSTNYIVGTRAFFSFKRTRVKDEYQVDVVKQPSTDAACSVSVPDGGKTNGKKYIGPTLGFDYYIPGGFELSCAPYTSLCANGKKDFRETDVDCGGGDCAPLKKLCGLGKACVADGDCGADGQSAVCANGACKKTYEVRGSLYTTVPLTLKLTPGGTSSAASATPRTLAVTPQQTSFAFTDTRVTSNWSLTYEEPAGATCKVTGGSGDVTGVSETFVNTASVTCTSCANGQREGKETGTDCGGADCRAEGKLCAAAAGCAADADCTSGSCDQTNKVCLAASCTNNRKDGSETGTDCGGSCVSQNKTCDLTVACSIDADCTSGICDGTSKTCVSCSDGLKNGAETAVDCGGTKCVGLSKTCSLTSACGVDADCASGICDGTSKTCVSCGDGLKNGAETATDCGGTKCVSLGKTCGASSACGIDADCASGTCDGTSKTCTSCSDGVKNGAETAIDCGGTKCVAEGKTCKLNDACAKSSDCNETLMCMSQVCKASASWTEKSAAAFSATTVRDAIALAVDNVYAIGDDKLAHYNGTSWSTETPLTADNQILAMFARRDTDVDLIWVGGADNAMQYFNGSSWFSTPPGFTGTAATYGLHGTSGLVIAVGSEGQIARFSETSGEFSSEFSSGGGGGLPGAGGPPPTSEDLHAVFVLDDSHAWAVGNNGAIVTFSAPTWSLSTSNTTANLRGVWASTVDDVWAVGEGGVVVHWNGSSWSTVSSGITTNLASIWGADASNIWAVGAGGKIRYFNGDSFSGETSGTTADLATVFGVSTTRWAMGTGAVLVERN